MPAADPVGTSDPAFTECEDAGKRIYRLYLAFVAFVAFVVFIALFFLFFAKTETGCASRENNPKRKFGRKPSPRFRFI